MGRKPLNDKPMPNRPLRILLTDAQRRTLDKEAKKNKQATATWAREVLLTAIRQ